MVQSGHCWLSTHITWKPFPCLPTVRADGSIPQESVMKGPAKKERKTALSLSLCLSAIFTSCRRLDESTGIKSLELMKLKVGCPLTRPFCLAFWDIVALLVEIHEFMKSFRRDTISYWNNSAFGRVLQLKSFDVSQSWRVKLSIEVPLCPIKLNIAVNEKNMYVY